MSIRDNSLQKTIIILYDVRYRYEAEYISEFFKLIGCLVTVREDTSGFMDGAENDFSLEKYQYILTIHEKNADRIQKPDAEKLERYAAGMFEDARGIRQMAEAYVQAEYCKLSYVKRYFGRAIDEEQKNELKRRFLLFHQFLNGILEEEVSREVMPHLEYALLLVARKVNDICSDLETGFHFSMKEMLWRCEHLIENPELSAKARELAASYCLKDASYRGNIIPLYSGSLQGIEDNPAIARIYYCMGQYFEKYMDDQKQADEMYEKGYQLQPSNYRILFKVATKLLDERKLTKASEAFEKLIELLECKRKYGMLFPVEYEYICKCYILLGRIHDTFWGDRYRAEEYYCSATDLIEKELHQSRFFEEFLGDQSGIYMKYLEQRIAVREHILIEKY